MRNVDKGKKIYLGKRELIQDNKAPNKLMVLETTDQANPWEEDVHIKDKGARKNKNNSKK